MSVYVCVYIATERSVSGFVSQIGTGFCTCHVQVVEGNYLPFSLSLFPDLIGAVCTQGRGKAGSSTSFLKINDCG